MAADLIENTRINQTFHHDIESTFFVLLWMALNYVECNLEVGQLSSDLRNIFSPDVFVDSGGSSKFNFMTSDSKRIPDFKNEPLNRLLSNFRHMLSFRHKKEPQQQEYIESLDDFKKRLDEFKSEKEKRMKMLDNHDKAIELFTLSTERPGWPSTDAAEQQSTVLSNREMYDLASSSKRCWDAALEGGDTTGQSSPRKRANLMP
jgi:hypothetical protein